MLDRLHRKIGDLWWYSAMIFIACRSGDVIQAFIGLWLVPKYVGAEELGAVMPLQNLSGLFAAPIAILAAVFAKFVNTYATRGEIGKVRSFIHDVTLSSCVVFIACILLAHLLMPLFYERLRIASGLLTVLILVAGFVANIALLFTNALQGLKRFGTLALINLIGAPIRLVTLLVFMPIRALSGYIMGQATPPTSASLVALFSLRKVFRNVRPDTSWRRDVPAMLRYAGPIAVWTVGGFFTSTILTTLFRQRLPEMESAAYYMLSKLAEVGGYLGMSVVVVLFPLAAEAHEQGRENRSVLVHAVCGSLIFSGLLAIGFALFGRVLFSFIPAWGLYLPYVHLLPPTTLTMGLSYAIGAFVTYEMACKRFRPIWIVIGLNALWVVLLVCFTGCEFFRGILSDTAVDWMGSLSIARLDTLTWLGFGYTLLQFVILALLHFTTRRSIQS